MPFRMSTKPVKSQNRTRSNPMRKQYQMTEASIRERVEEIGLDVYIGAADPTEPLDELIDRVRVGLQDEFDRIAELYQRYESELDRFEEVLAELSESAPHP